MKKDPNLIVRLIPLIAAAIGSVLLLINRLTTVELTPSQARSDVVGVILSGMLALVWLIWQQVQPVPPDSVTLVGKEGLEFAPDLSDTVKIELAWASHLLLTNTVTKSLIVYYQGRVLLRLGILGINSEVNPGTIVKRVLENQKPVYLVNLNLYPGKVEFDYLPENTQGLICQQMGKAGVLILAANVPRSYTKQDENWIEVIADKLGNTLDQGLV